MKNRIRILALAALAVLFSLLPGMKDQGRLTGAASLSQPGSGQFIAKTFTNSYSDAERTEIFTGLGRIIPRTSFKNQISHFTGAAVISFAFHFFSTGRTRPVPAVPCIRLTRSALIFPFHYFW